MATITTPTRARGRHRVPVGRVRRAVDGLVTSALITPLLCFGLVFLAPIITN
jgi:hypothetical protein